MELYEYQYANPYKSCNNGQICPISGNPTTCWDPTYKDPNYARFGYKTHKQIAKVEGVTGVLDFKFTPKQACVPEMGRLPYSYRYYQDFYMSNFTMLLYGYFRPKITGKHTFSFRGDDLVYVNFGAQNAFDCCQHDTTKDAFGNYQAYSIWPDSDNTRTTIEVNLQANAYYPIRIFFNNRDSVASLDFSFSVNGGWNINDFTEYFFSVNDVDGGCAGKFTYSTTCRSDIQTTNTYSTNVQTNRAWWGAIPSYTTTYFVEVPCPTGNDCKDGFYDPIAQTCGPIDPNKPTTTPTTTPTPPPDPHDCTDKTARRIDGLSMDLYEYPFLNPLVPCANGIGLDGQKGYCPQNGPLVNDQCWRMDYFDDKNYPYSTYLNYPRIGHVDGVSGSLNVNFIAKYDCVIEKANLPNNYNFPNQITMTNYTMVLSGYFVPKQSGTHTFKFSGDDIINLDFGDAVDLQCCMPAVTSDSVKDHNKYQSVWPNNQPPTEVSLDLQAGNYYPMRLFYTNRDRNSIIDLSVTTPDGQTTNDLSGLTYTFKSC